MAVEAMTEAASKGQRLPEHISATAAGVSQVAAAVRTVASTVTDRSAQKRIIQAGQLVNIESLNVISVSRVLALDHTNAGKVDDMKGGKKQFRAALHALLAAPKGLDSKDIDEAKETIAKASEELKEFNKRGWQQGDPELKESSRALASSTKALSAAVAQYGLMTLTNPLALGSSAKMTALTTMQLLQAAGFAANAARQDGANKSIVQGARRLADVLIKLLEQSKATSAQKKPEDVAAFNKTEAEAREALDTLIRALGAASSQESEEAISSITTLIALLNDEEGANVDKIARAKLLEKFLNAAQNMARVTGDITRAAKVSAAKLGALSKEAVFAVEGLVDSARAGAKGANQYTPLEGRLLTACRLIAEQPLNTRQVVALSQGVVLASLKLIDEAKAYAAAHAKDDKEKERLRSLAIESVKLVNAVQRLGASARLSITHDDKDVTELVQIAEDVADSVRALAHATKKEDELLTVQIASKLTDATRAIAVATTGHIRAANAVSLDENNAESERELLKSAEAIQQAIQDLANTVSILNPGVRQCELAAKQMQIAAAEVEGLMVAIDSNPTPRTPSAANAKKFTLAEYQTKSADHLKQLGIDVNKVQDNAKAAEADALAAVAQKIDNDFKNVIELLRFTAGATEDREKRSTLLELSKSLADAMFDLFKAAKATNPSDKPSVERLAKATGGVQEIIGRLLNDLQSGAQLVADLEKTAAALAAAGKTLDGNAKDGKAKFAQARDELAGNTRSLGNEARKFLLVDRANAGDVNVTVNALANDTQKLLRQTQAAIAATPSADAKKAMKAKTEAIVTDVVGMIRHLAAAVEGHDRSEDLKTSFQQVNTDIAELLKAAKQGDVAEGIFDDASSKLGAVIQQLNTTAIFAQAGQLDPRDYKTEGLSFKALMDRLSKEVDVMLDTVGKLSAATKADDVATGKAGVVSVNAMEKVAEGVMANASKLDDKVGQQNLLVAGRTAATSLQKFLDDAKAAAQASTGDTTKEKVLAATEEQVRAHAKEIVRILHAVGADMIRGEKELEAAKQTVAKLMDTAPALDSTTALDVTKAGREVVAVVASLVQANTQDEVIEAAKKITASTEALVKAVKTAAQKLAPDQGVAAKITDAGKASAAALVAFLEINKMNRQDEGVRPKIEKSATQVTAALNQIVEALRLLPQQEDLKLTLIEEEEKVVEIDHSLELLAEEELRKAAKAIDEVTKSLIQAQPRTKARVEGVIEKEDIDEAILQGVRAISAATNTLVKASEGAQRDRRETSAKTGARYHIDEAWSNGLISAAKAVSTAVGSLVKGANNTVQGKAAQGELVNAANAVASATANLVAASKTKSDPDNASVRSLTAAAKQVAQATQKLVEAANAAAKIKEQTVEADASDEYNAAAAAQKAELDQQIKIAGLESQLEKERRKLAAMRKARMKK